MVVLQRLQVIKRVPAELTRGARRSHQPNNWHRRNPPSYYVLTAKEIIEDDSSSDSDAAKPDKKPAAVKKAGVNILPYRRSIKIQGF